MKNQTFIIQVDRQTLQSALLALLVADLTAGSRGEKNYQEEYRKAYSKLITEKNRVTNLTAI